MLKYFNSNNVPHQMSVRKSGSWDLLLLLTAIIWGFAFVAQRVGMEYMGPFAFNGIRFALGAFSLIPLIIWQSKKRPGRITSVRPFVI